MAAAVDRPPLGRIITSASPCTTSVGTRTPAKAARRSPRRRDRGVAALPGALVPAPLEDPSGGLRFDRRVRVAGRVARRPYDAPDLPELPGHVFRAPDLPPGPPATRIAAVSLM